MKYLLEYNGANTNIFTMGQLLTVEIKKTWGNRKICFYAIYSNCGGVNSEHECAVHFMTGHLLRSPENQTSLWITVC